MRRFWRAGWAPRGESSPRPAYPSFSMQSWQAGYLSPSCGAAPARAMARGSYSGLERLIVFSRSPQVVGVFHLMLRAMADCLT